MSSGYKLTLISRLRSSSYKSRHYIACPASLSCLLVSLRLLACIFLSLSFLLSSVCLLVFFYLSVYIFCLNPGLLSVCIVAVYFANISTCLLVSFWLPPCLLLCTSLSSSCIFVFSVCLFVLYPPLLPVCLLSACLLYVCVSAFLSLCLPVWLPAYEAHFLREMKSFRNDHFDTSFGVAQVSTVI